MSGPKVVRIVTREEVISICEGHLARLEAAVASWKHACADGHLATETDVVAVTARHAELRSLLAKDLFLEIQKRAPQEIEFLTADLARRRELVVEAKARARSLPRRLALTAKTLIDRATSGGGTIPPELLRDLEAARDGIRDGAQAAERAINATLTHLASADTEHLTERQRLIASRLGRDQDTQTLAHYLAVKSDERDAIEAKIDRYIAELTTHAGPAAVTEFERRATALLFEPSLDRRKLLTDSLVLDLAEATRRHHERAKIMSWLRGLEAELAHLTPGGSSDLLSRVALARDSESVDAARLFGEEAELEIKALREEITTRARRAVVLDALSRLGYEIREGMNTAWSENGHVVLRHATRTASGVKISGGQGSAPMQFRAIGYKSPNAAPDHVADRDTEVLWCSEVDELKSLLAVDGSDFVIEKSLEPGTTPLEIITDEALHRPESGASHSRARRPGGPLP